MKRSLFVFFALGVLAAFATAEEKPPAKPALPSAANAGVSAAPPTAPAPDAKQASASAGLLRYLPPARGAPRMRVGGGTRSQSSEPGARVEVLSPEELGRTLSESPSLYWHLSQPTQARVDFTLVDQGSVAPLVEKTLPGPFEAGVHRIDLTGLGVRLAPGTEYQWYVSLVTDPDERSADVVAGGGVELVEAAALREEVARAPASQQPTLLAQGGIWYDAIDALSRRIEQAPADPLPREQRAALLEQVGLAEVAAGDRSAPSAQR